MSLSVFHHPEIIGQPEGTTVWWGYGLYPERNGDFVRKPMMACTGGAYVNNIGLPRRRGDRPPPVLEGATNDPLPV